MAESLPKSKNFNSVGTESAHPEVASPDHGIVAKKGHSKSGAPDNAGTATHRAGVLERNGFKGAPQMQLYVPNSDAAAQVGRSIVVVPSTMGNRDFWTARARQGNISSDI
jgi:hypothetical protein